ncbi:MAG TPA: peptidoglycan DD-metalloendopeptidase family protein [Patescibacteria group bacterium]|nr:peptidoglycan DD-metalloendopeptidase family protein [Patescibacteria group bacterium]
MKPIAKALGFFISLIGRYILFPIYSAVVILKIRISRVLLSARGFFFLIFTNRYVFHAALLILSIATIASQLQTKNATAYDAGRGTMLYALVTNGQDDVVEESTQGVSLAKNANYLGTSTIDANPGVDYDYEPAQNQSSADLTVPGSISVLPQIETPGSLAETPVPARSKTETYVVESGDTIASIASKFGVNVGTILWANNLTDRSTIHPGESLKIPPVSGVLHLVKKGDTVEKIANLYNADAEEIYRANNLADHSTLALGQELIIPGGEPPAPPAPPAKPKAPTVAIKSDVPKTSIAGKTYDQYQELTQSVPDTRTKPPDETVANLPSGKLLWPTRSHTINQYYGWFHTGIDLDGDYTDPIYAAEDGVVESAGWNSGGYGLMVMIDHQNGFKTRYGHASKLFVSAGDHVTRGQVIGMIGTTGRSTGTHLHFEVYVNEKRVNPLGYIK